VKVEMATEAKAAPARAALAACRVIVVLIAMAAWRSEAYEMTMELRMKLLLIKTLQPIAVEACWRGAIRKSYLLHGSLSTAPAHNSTSQPSCQFCGW
jgi:hypothetical protein